MANTATVYVRMDKTLKENAEEILSKLGITPSGAVQMLYSQIVLRQGIPFPVTLQPERPVAIGGMTREEMNTELYKGLASLKKAKSLTSDEVERKLHQELGI